MSQAESQADFDVFAQSIAQYLGPEEVDQVRKAYEFAEAAHLGQKRQTGEPYVTHPLEVASILADLRMDHQSLMAAMLHDVIEDSATTKEILSELFGETVADLVDGVSKLTHLPFESKAHAQAENFQKMALAMAKDIRVIMVKMADRLHNMRTLGIFTREKRHRIAQETMEIYAPIAHRLGIHSLFVEFEDLGFRAMYPMRARCIHQALLKARGNRNELMQKIQDSIVHCLKREGLQGQVIGREKHLFSIYQKMRLKGQSFQNIMDVYAFRIIVDKIDTCYRVLGAMHGLYKPVVGRFKDYIAVPKANGYQSLHTTLFGMHGVPIEIQIRTQEMNELADSGIAAHWRYRQSSSNDHDNEAGSVGSQARARHWVNSLLDLQKSAGNSIEFIESAKIDLFPSEVYVFTPKGRILNLPKGATPIDFAYAVHTDIGNACMACRINRRLAPLSTPLESGQTADIITSKGVRPNPSWLNFAVTAKARSHIRQALKHQRRDESVRLGERLLNKALQEWDTNIKALPPTQVDAVLHINGLKHWDDLLEEIGLGNRMALIEARRLVASDATVVSQSQEPLQISGTEGIVVAYAKCCRPIPNDPILGHLSAGRGMVVHWVACKNVVGQDHPDRYVPLRWAPTITTDFSVELRLFIETQRSLIAVIASAVNTTEANVLTVESHENDGRVTEVNLCVSVKDRVHLARVIKKIRRLKGLLHVQRSRS